MARTLVKMDQEDRIALFLDYENLALGARDHLGGMTFDFRPIAVALAERGRVVVRRAYHNIFLVRLTGDGRCHDFVEYYMREPAGQEGVV